MNKLIESAPMTDSATAFESEHTRTHSVGPGPSLLFTAHHLDRHHRDLGSPIIDRGFKTFCDAVQGGSDDPLAMLDSS